MCEFVTGYVCESACLRDCDRACERRAACAGRSVAGDSPQLSCPGSRALPWLPPPLSLT